MTAERICPHNDRMWFICYNHKEGLVPLSGHHHIHQKDAWYFYLEARKDGAVSDDDKNVTQESAEAEGYVARRFWLSLKRKDTLF